MTGTVAESLMSTVKLNDDVIMPLFGLGTFRLDDAEAAVSVMVKALQAGYRMLDTAVIYKNEKEVGRAVRESGISRDQIFVVTKVDTENGHGREEVKLSLRGSLDRLGLDFVDLLLIHSPVPGNLTETYRGMCELKEQGLVRSIGVSKFEVRHLKGLQEAGLPTPSVNQIEVHPWWPQTELVAYCRKQGIAVMGFAPLAKGNQFDNPQTKQLAEKYSRTPAQILIRWSIQCGVITIPKTSNPDRVIQNLHVFDWSLDQHDFQSLTTGEDTHRYGFQDISKVPWIN